MAGRQNAVDEDHATEKSLAGQGMAGRQKRLLFVVPQAP